MKYEKVTPAIIKAHDELEDPALLGLGELEMKDVERRSLALVDWISSFTDPLPPLFDAAANVRVGVAVSV
ncbi:MAG TPA: hypothetical protein VF081_13445 [Solirubrobacterales bacterium]